MKWITHTHVHVDRAASCWLIQRFIDSQAEFLFVTKDIVLQVAEKEDAIPFDINGVALGHQNGHCSFVSILENYQIMDPALLALGDVINACDSAHIDAHPYGPGLEAIVSGMSLLIPDDFLNLEQQFPLYDALYATLKLRNQQ
jgi:hypothetical protein